jgi:hypothetical protein
VNVAYKYTRHQVPRGTMADAERNDALFVIKSVSCLRLTYQIRLLTYRAFTLRKKFIINVPEHCQIYPTLRDFQEEHSKIVRIERFESHGTVPLHF